MMRGNLICATTMCRVMLCGTWLRVQRSGLKQRFGLPRLA
jgi:hypothetical protein